MSYRIDADGNILTDTLEEAVAVSRRLRVRSPPESKRGSVPDAIRVVLAKFPEGLKASEIIRAIADYSPQTIYANLRGMVMSGELISPKRAIYLLVSGAA